MILFTTGIVTQTAFDTLLPYWAEY